MHGKAGSHRLFLWEEGNAQGQWLDKEVNGKSCGHNIDKVDQGNPGCHMLGKERMGRQVTLS